MGVTPLGKSRKGLSKPFFEYIKLIIFVRTKIILIDQVKLYILKKFFFNLKFKKKIRVCC